MQRILAGKYGIMGIKFVSNNTLNVNNQVEICSEKPVSYMMDSLPQAEAGVVLFSFVLFLPAFNGGANFNNNVDCLLLIFPFRDPCGFGHIR